MIALVSFMRPDFVVWAMLAGILLVYFECNRPGSILPGCLGSLLILLSLHRFHQLPLRSAGLLLLTFGVSATIVAVVARPYLFGLAGTLLVSSGLRMLIEPFRIAGVHLTTALIAGLLFVVATVGLGRIALCARTNKRTPNNACHEPARHRIDWSHQVVPARESAPDEFVP